MYCINIAMFATRLGSIPPKKYRGAVFEKYRNTAVYRNTAEYRKYRDICGILLYLRYSAVFAVLFKCCNTARYLNKIPQFAVLPQKMPSLVNNRCYNPYIDGKISKRSIKNVSTKTEEYENLYQTIPV